MTLRYYPGVEPPGEVVVSQRQAVAGYAIGIIVIDIWYPLLPGNVANASTYEFPVVHKVLKGASVEQILRGDPALLDLIIKAGHELVDMGVGAIVGACGSFAFFQKDAAAALPVPTFLSVMLQAPLILQSLRPDQRLGVIAASAASINERVFTNCDIADPSRLAVIGCMDLPEFARMAKCAGAMNIAKLEKELVEHVLAFVKTTPDIGALLLQCSDLPPYAWAIQKAVNLPVFDMNNLIEWVYRGVIRRPYGGFL